MCGIAGIWSRQRSDGARLGRMLDLLRHRGPDDEGAVRIAPITGEIVSGRGDDTHPSLQLPSYRESSFRAELLLGHRRLSILDLTESGHQPMSDPSGRYWMTYNGEIYNYLELRQELEGTGIQFKSRSDSEVLLYAFMTWGPNCLNRLNGMWAFAIYDREKQTLFCSRDRFGIKPFYYHKAPDEFLFASEIKPLLAAGIEARPDEEAVYHYLLFSRCHTPGKTFFEGIHELKAGHSLEVTRGEAAIEKRWYDPGRNPAAFDGTKTASTELRNRLEDAVSLRLRSDVAAGGCLSGGLDSTLITALCQKHEGRDHATFTASYLGFDQDESAYAAEAALRTGASPHYVYPSGPRLWRELSEVVRAQEEPFGSTSIYAQWCVMRKAREENVPVLLDGQGADELFAGYHRYRMNAALESRNPAGILSALFVPHGFNLLISALTGPGLARQALRHMPVDRLICKGLHDRHRSSAETYLTERLKTQSSLNRTLDADLTHYSLPALLRYADRNSMRFSIEARLPFLDYRIVELAQSLPPSSKIQNGCHKAVLRESCSGLIPDRIRTRKDKIGFSTPEHSWLQPANSFIQERLSSGKLLSSRWIREDRLLSLLNREHGSGALLWKIVNLELWLEHLIEPCRKANREDTYSLPVLSS